MKKICKLYSNKRIIIIGVYLLLILLGLMLNIAFSDFTIRSEKVVSNIKVAGMNYNIAINGISGTKLTSTSNKTTKANIIINSLNNQDSKYELTYKICSNQNCTEYIDKPENLIIEYSSRTIDTVTGSITSEGYKQIRIIVTNNTTNTYYIELGINAGYIYNTLALENLITTEYNEEDVKIAAIIDGEISTTFPKNNNYSATVACTVNNNPASASGTATWNGTEWVINITGVKTGQTICNVNFKDILLRNIIAKSTKGVRTSTNKYSPYPLTYKEKISEDYHEITELIFFDIMDQRWYIGFSREVLVSDTYTFNKTTHRYNLTNSQSVTSYDSSLVGKYVCSFNMVSGTTSQCDTLYKIKEVSTYIYESTEYQVISKADRLYYEPETYDQSDVGVFETDDDYGKSYYFRGNVKNNWLYFAGQCWRIIRVNGDNSIRIMYTGTPSVASDKTCGNMLNAPITDDGARAIGSGTNAGTSIFTPSTRETAPLGYNQTTGTASTMRTTVENWYVNKLSSYSSYLSDSGFCGDRTSADKTNRLLTGTCLGYFAAYDRMNTSKPSLKCETLYPGVSSSDDVFKVSNPSPLGKINYPIGLITSDELFLAGASSSYYPSGQKNISFVYSDTDYTSLSLYQIGCSSGNYTSRTIGFWAPFTNLGLINSGANIEYRPVVNLLGTTKVDGTGSYNDPYTIR